MDDGARREPDVGEILVDLGRRLREPLSALRSALDAKSNDAGELASWLDPVLDTLEELFAPWMALSRFTAQDAGSASPAGDGETVMVKSLVRELAGKRRPPVEVRIRGELGVLHARREPLAACLSLFLDVLGPGPVFVRREVHVPHDQIALGARMDSARLQNGAFTSPMAVLRGVAHAMGGTLEAEEVPGEPASLTLAFPAPRSAPVAAETHERRKDVEPVLAFRRDVDLAAPSEPSLRAAEPPAAARPMVLVVESEPTARQYMTHVLELEGFEVEATNSASEARERARTVAPDVIVMDQLQLGRRRETDDPTRAFRDDPALARIPVVLVRNPENEEALGLAGASGWISKPFDPAELVGVVKSLIGGDASPVLVVHAEQETRVAWRAAVEQAGMRVVEAANAFEARHLLAKMSPLALVVDVGSLERGVELTEALAGATSAPTIAVHGELGRSDHRRLASAVRARLLQAAATPPALQSLILDVIAREEDLSDASAG